MPAFIPMTERLAKHFRRESGIAGQVNCRGLR